MLLEKEYYDTSNYDPFSPLFSTVNEKVIGKFRDECKCMSLLEFVGLRAKTYSLFEEKEKPSKRTVKNVKRGFV